MHWKCIKKNFETIFFSKICNFMKWMEYINNAFSTQNEVTEFFLCCEYFSCFWLVDFYYFLNVKLCIYIYLVCWLWFCFIYRWTIMSFFFRRRDLRYCEMLFWCCYCQNWIIKRKFRTLVSFSLSNLFSVLYIIFLQFHKLMQPIIKLIIKYNWSHNF